MDTPLGMYERAWSGERGWPLYAGTAIWGAFLGYLSVTISTMYLTESLAHLASALGIGSNLAGILLLSAGNSLPDLLSNVLTYKMDASLLVDSVSGSSIFLITIVAGAGIFARRRKERLNRNEFYHLLCFLILTMGHLLWFHLERGTKACGVSMLITYCVFILGAVQAGRDGASDFPAEIDGIKPAAPLKHLLDTCMLAGTAGSGEVPHGALIASPLINAFAWNFAYTGNLIGIDNALVYLAGSATVSFLLLCGRKNRNCKMRRVYSFASSMVWIGAISLHILSLVIVVGSTMGVPRTLMTVTMVALNNCLGDLLSVVGAARGGLYKVAICAALSAPMQNVLFNLGVICVSHDLKGITRSSSSDYAVLFTTCALTVLFVNFEMRSGLMEKEVALFLGMIYSLFVSCCIHKPLINT